MVPLWFLDFVDIFCRHLLETELVRSLLLYDYVIIYAIYVCECC